MSKQARNAMVSVTIDDVSPPSVERAAWDIAQLAAVRALSGREMSARDVWERMRDGCDKRESCECVSNMNVSWRCDMAHCPRLK